MANNNSVLMKSLTVQQPDLQQKNLDLQLFWQRIREEIQSLKIENENFLKQEYHCDLVHKIMLDESNSLAPDKQMSIEIDAPIILAKAAEMFVLELALRAWQGKADTDCVIKKEDIVGVITTTDIFDILTV